MGRLSPDYRSVRVMDTWVIPPSICAACLATIRPRRTPRTLPHRDRPDPARPAARPDPPCRRRSGLLAIHPACDADHAVEHLRAGGARHRAFHAGLSTAKGPEEEAAAGGVRHVHSTPLTYWPAAAKNFRACCWRFPEKGTSLIFGGWRFSGRPGPRRVKPSQPRGGPAPRGRGGRPARERLRVRRARLGCGR